MRILIIEDRQALADEYLRIFSHILKGNFSYTHVSTIERALTPLAEENWDVIFIDNELGQGSVYPHNAEDGIKINNGYDLVKFRRDMEKDEGIERSYIVGIASNQVALGLFQNTRADDWFLKLFIPEMANLIYERAPMGTFDPIVKQEV